MQSEPDTGRHSARIAMDFVSVLLLCQQAVADVPPTNTAEQSIASPTADEPMLDLAAMVLAPTVIPMPGAGLPFNSGTSGWLPLSQVSDRADVRDALASASWESTYNGTVAY